MRPTLPLPIDETASMKRLTDEQWQIVEHLFPVKQKRGAGRPPASPRAVLDAIRWVQAHQEGWLYLPNDFPAQQTCYIKLLEWRKDGRLALAEHLLNESQQRDAATRAP